MRASAWLSAPSAPVDGTEKVVPKIKVLGPRWNEYLANQERLLLGLVAAAVTVGWLEGCSLLVDLRRVVDGLLDAATESRAMGDEGIYRREFLAVRDSARSLLSRLARGGVEIEGDELMTAARSFLVAPIPVKNVDPGARGRFSGVVHAAAASDPGKVAGPAESGDQDDLAL